MHGAQGVFKLQAKLIDTMVHATILKEYNTAIILFPSASNRIRWFESAPASTHSEIHGHIDE